MHYCHSETLDAGEKEQQAVNAVHKVQHVQVRPCWSFTFMICHEPCWTALVGYMMQSTEQSHLVRQHAGWGCGLFGVLVHLHHALCLQLPSQAAALATA